MVFSMDVSRALMGARKNRAIVFLAKVYNTQQALLLGRGLRARRPQRAHRRQYPERPMPFSTPLKSSLPMALSLPISAIANARHSRANSAQHIRTQGAPASAVSLPFPRISPLPRLARTQVLEATALCNQAPIEHP